MGGRLLDCVRSIIVAVAAAIEIWQVYIYFSVWIEVARRIICAFHVTISTIRVVTPARLFHIRTFHSIDRNSRPSQFAGLRHSAAAQ